MSPIAALIMIIGLPLILMAAGFLIIAIKVFGSGPERVERGQTLEAARQIERSLAAMESRLNALEDILLNRGQRKGTSDE